MAAPAGDQIHVVVPVPDRVRAAFVRGLGVGLGVPEDVVAVHRDAELVAEPRHQRGRGAILLVRRDQPFRVRDVLDADAVPVGRPGVPGDVVVLDHLHDLAVLPDDVVGADLRRRVLEPAHGAVDALTAVGDVDNDPVDRSRGRLRAEISRRRRGEPAGLGVLRGRGVELAVVTLGRDRGRTVSDRPADVVRLVVRVAVPVAGESAAPQRSSPNPSSYATSAANWLALAAGFATAEPLAAPLPLEWPFFAAGDAAIGAVPGWAMSPAHSRSPSFASP